MILPIEIIPYVNIACLAIVLIFVVIGLSKGFLLMAIEFFSLIVTLLLSYVIAPSLAESINLAGYFSIDIGIDVLNVLIESRINQLLWFIVVFVALMVVFAVVRTLFRSIGNVPIIKEINALLGGLFGLLKGYLLLLLVIFILTTPFVRNGNIILEETALGKIYDITASLFEAYKEPTQFNQMLQDIINNHSIKQEQLDEFSSWLQKNVGDEFKNKIIQQIHIEGE